MRVLTSTLPRVRRLFQGDVGFTLGLFLSLTALEYLGRRRAGSDVHDLLGMAMLAAVVAAVVFRHRQRPLGWLTSSMTGARRLGDWFADRFFRFELGLDLRGEPDLPRRLPRGTFSGFALTIAWAAIALAIWYAFPAGWRTLGTGGFYLGYLVLLSAIWSALLIAILIGVVGPLYELHQYLSSDRHGPKRGEWLWGMLYLVLVFTAVWRVSVWPVLAFCLVSAIVFALFMAFLPRLGHEQFIWRAGPDRPVFAVSTRRLIMGMCVTIILIQMALIVTGTGSTLIGNRLASEAMPVTVMLGSLAAWLTPGAILAGIAELFAWWWSNPARQRPPIVHVLGGHLVPPNRTIIREAALHKGWRVRWDEPEPGSPEVAVRLVEPYRSEATEFDPRWPLAVSVDDLKQGEVFERVERRQEIQWRRNLTRGLERLFKSISGQPKKDGSGSWIGPHLWFMTGVVRDDTDPQDERDDAPMLAKVVGPTYDRVFHRGTRSYCYRLMRKLSVDLIFVEDGISYRRFQRVLRVMFEIVDRFGNDPERCRAREVHFNGLPKMKVMIHDFTVDRPFQSEGYPEPKFEDLGRARILHVFRDRGGEEEFIEPPGDFSRSPAPVLVG